MLFFFAYPPFKALPRVTVTPGYWLFSPLQQWPTPVPLVKCRQYLLVAEWPIEPA